MQSVSLSSAYQIQKKFLRRNHIKCFKVGASNYSSGEFFNIDDVIVGGILSSNIFFSGCPKNYSIAELELVVKIRLDNDADNGYQVLSNYIGVECPLIEINNPSGNTVLAIADNCSAGDLLIISDYTGDYAERIKVFVNGHEVTVGDFANLRFSVNEIIRRAIAIIKEHELSCEQEMLIATGGLTENFSLSANDCIEVRYE